jgi:hypothetical protein
MDSSTNIPTGKVVGALTDEEKSLLVKQIEATIKSYRIGFIFACISIVIIVGIIIAPAMFVAIRKQQKKLKIIQNNEVKVYELTGILSLKNVSTKGNLYACFIDDHMVPGEVIKEKDASNIQGHVNEKVSFQYVPSISKNRAYSDSTGHSYNFITKSDK